MAEKTTQKQIAEAILDVLRGKGLSPEQGITEMVNAMLDIMAGVGGVLGYDETEFIRDMLNQTINQLPAEQNAPEKIKSNGVEYIRADVPEKVYARIYTLIKDQKEYFKTRDKELMKSCQKREDGFLEWYKNGLETKQELNNQTSLQL